MCVPIHVDLFREWKTTTLSWSLSVRVGVMTENGGLMEAMWNGGCTQGSHAFHATIIGIYHMDPGIKMIGIMTPFRQEIFGKSMCAK